MNAHEATRVVPAEAVHFEFQFVLQGVEIECRVDERAFERWRRLGDHGGSIVQFRKYARAIAAVHMAHQTTRPGERWRVTVDEGHAFCMRVGS